MSCFVAVMNYPTGLTSLENYFNKLLYVFGIGIHYVFKEYIITLLLTFLDVEYRMNQTP